MFGSRVAAIVVAGMAGVVVLQPAHAYTGWWHHTPADYEDCAGLAERLATKKEKTKALGDCSAKFAGRRKPGGGYTYYDFLQDRSFDIAGPNPTPQEQKYIDEQYTLYLESQQRKRIVAAFTARQQEQERKASLGSEMENVPLPQARPTKRQFVPGRTAFGGIQRRGRACTRRSFSCEWPRLSETIRNLKKLLAPHNDKKG